MSKINLHKKTLDLYVDDEGRQYIANKNKNIAYFLPKALENKYSVFAGRYLVAGILILFLALEFDWMIGIIAGIAVAFISEIYYQKSFIASLTSTTNIEFKEKINNNSYINDQPKAKSILIVVAIIVLLILLYINLVMSIESMQSIFEINNLILLIVTIAITIYCVSYAIKLIKAILKNK